LARPAFKKCGRNLQIATDVTIGHPNRVELGDDVFIARGTWMTAYGGVELADQAILGPYTTIVTANHSKLDGSWRFGPPKVAPVRIGRGAWTGAHSVITPGVDVGDGACVGAGAVVTKSVAPDATVFGVPARPVKP
jgi:acetyltransferase-like isoleucine patch superfamily enzyme